jgi:ATP-dependent DNA helicase DinG
MTWQDAEERFAEVLPGYESRVEQKRLAETIQKALGNGNHLLAQAGTGTGKSLAGLVPAIEHARASGSPVIVSTATKALQHQYGDKDLPFLQEYLGILFTWALLKGRSNYACRAKVAELDDNSVENQAAILAELDTPGHSGDLEELIAAVDPKDRIKLTSTSDECPGGSECPFASVCFSEKAKERARESDIVLVNHAMLATDLLIRSKQDDSDKEPTGILPSFGAVLIDEAHELAEYTTGMLSNEFSERGLIHFASEITNFLGREKAGQVTFLLGSSKKIFRGLETYLGKSTTKSLTNGAIFTLIDEFENLAESLRNVHEEIKKVDTTGDDRKAVRRRRLMRRSSAMLARFEDIVEAEADALVRWVERDARRNDVRLKYAPLTVAPFLRDNLWSKHTGVLLSATLAIGKDFSYVAGTVGLDDYEAFDAGSPFDYPKQATLFVPPGFDPSPANSQRWRILVWESQKRLITAAGGRALLLFTSTEAMDQSYDAIAPYLRSQGLVTLKQGDQPNKMLAATFKADETSVLFGLKSFATGFDVQGDALRLVILDKLPFNRPDDVIFKARCDAIDAVAQNKWVDGAFPKLSVPSMALTLFQAAGRLIRSKTDQGMIAIFDSRLLPKNLDMQNSKGYGVKILNALPPARRIYKIEEAEEYLTSLSR